jgi:protein-S-isoprenylcysteine O-methyltransferase Ste14
MSDGTSSQFVRWWTILVALSLNAALISLPFCWWFGFDSIGLIEALFLVCASGFCLGDMLGQRDKPLSTAPIRRDPNSIMLCRWTGYLVLVMFVASPLSGRMIDTESANWSIGMVSMGTALILVGSYIRFLAIQTLGEFFESEVKVRREQPVVRHGIYSVLRHPSECGTLLATLGAALFFANWATFSLWLICIVPLVIYRVQREDRCLTKAFGAPYQNYVNSVSRLIPRLY